MSQVVHPADYAHKLAAGVAKQIEQDIYRRQLKPGERYLSTRQVVEQYAVKLAVAAQAMRRLVDQGVLVRRDRSGTYIGPSVYRAPGVGIQTVYIVTPRERMDYSNLPLYLLVQAMHRNSPGVNVQFTYLPSSDEVRYLEELLAPIEVRSRVAGFIAVSCTHEVYAHLDSLGVPLVVLGTPESDQRHLRSVGIDTFESGRLLAQHLLRQGHEGIAVFTLGAGQQPGDNNFVEGVAEALTEANRPPNALIVRCSLYSLRLFRAQVDSVLAKEPRPTGLICRSEKMLDVTLAALSDAGVDASSVEIVCEKSSDARGPELFCRHTRATWPHEKIMDQVVALLQDSRVGDATRHVVVPVEFAADAAVPASIDPGTKSR